MRVKTLGHYQSFSTLKIFDSARARVQLEKLQSRSRSFFSRPCAHARTKKRFNAEQVRGSSGEQILKCIKTVLFFLNKSIAQCKIFHEKVGQSPQRWMILKISIR